MNKKHFEVEKPTECGDRPKWMKEGNELKQLQGFMFRELDHRITNKIKDEEKS